jgi:hypothetical protein
MVLPGVQALFGFQPTYLLLGSTFPLMIGITLDFYLIARLILENNILSLLLSIALLIWFVTFWFLLPRLKKPRKAVRRDNDDQGRS